MITSQAHKKAKISIVSSPCKSTMAIQFQHGEEPCPELCREYLGVELTERDVEYLRCAFRQMTKKDWLQITAA